MAILTTGIRVDYPWGLDMHGHAILVVWPLSSELWPWPWEFVHAPVPSVLMPVSPDYACGLPIRGRYAQAWNFGPLTLGLWPWPWESCRCSRGQSIDASVASLSQGSLCMGTTMRGSCACAWNFGPVTLDLGNLVDTSMPKVLKPRWPICACGLSMRDRCAWAQKFGPVTFGFGSWVWPWGSCGCSGAQGIDASVASLCTWTIHEE